MNTNTYFVLTCNVLALFTFYALPSGGKSKDAVVHCHEEVFAISICKSVAFNDFETNRRRPVDGFQSHQTD